MYIVPFSFRILYDEMLETKTFESMVNQLLQSFQKQDFYKGKGPGIQENSPEVQTILVFFTT